MLISIVSGLIAFCNSSKLMIPSLSTERYVTSNPCFCKLSHVFITAGCSMQDVIICFPLSARAYAMPLIAQLSLSVPPDVKYISLGFAPIALAIFSLASSTALLASLPQKCWEEALPKTSVKYGVISLSTSGSVYVVAELSK